MALATITEILCWRCSVVDFHDFGVTEVAQSDVVFEKITNSFA